MAVITINYANLPPSGEDQYGNGDDAPDYNTADLDGFTLFNQYRQNPQYGANTQQTSQDYGSFYDGPGFLFQAAGGSGPLSMKLTQDNGSNFSFESIQLDTNSAIYQNVQVTFTGYNSTGTSLGQMTVTLNNSQGPQTFNFSNLNNVSYIEIAPTAVNLQFNDITLDTAPLCFAAGTCISTTRGEVTVEHIKVGDTVVTSSGHRRPVKWLGHRTIDCTHNPNPRGVMPFCVRPHAFGENRPSRDLLLSPGHSVCLDLYGEVLVPISLLANGATIAQLDVKTVTYWHVELETHDIILAENLPCESYIDCGTRAFFAESDVVDLGALPDACVLTTGDYCRPFHPEGALVDFARERLCLRANDLGWRLEVVDPLGGLWLEVDGQRVVPLCDGLVARVTLPASARHIFLCSDAAVPADIHGARDERRLGLQLASLVADDGLHWRHEMACTDERLVDGFHAHEGGLRWTDGRARLPSDLWRGARDMFVLRLAFAGPGLPRWVAPPAVEAMGAETEAASRLAQLAAFDQPLRITSRTIAPTALE